MHHYGAWPCYLGADGRGPSHLYQPYQTSQETSPLQLAIRNVPISSFCFQWFESLNLFLMFQFHEEANHTGLAFIFALHCYSPSK